MILKEAFDYSLAFLKTKSADEAEFKALCLVCSLAGVRNSQFEQKKSEAFSFDLLDEKLSLLAGGEPLQYVIGKWDFYESEFFVGRGVLIPRPETEELVELAIKEAKKFSTPVVYDLCSGSGCIGISIAKALPDSAVYCVEKSKNAFKYLEENIILAPNACSIKGDIFKPEEFIDSFKKADVIVSNPPYIRSDEIRSLQTEVQKEPIIALDGGVDGLDFYRAIIKNFSNHLNQNGVLILEIGNEQGESVSEMLVSSGFSDVEIIKDIYGNDRIVKAK